MSRYLPDHSESITDGALGLATDSSDEVVFGFGVCSGGVANQLYGPYVSADQAVSDLGYGPLVSWIAFQLAISKGKPVYVVKITGSTPGANTAVTPSNGAGPLVTLTGAPFDRGDWVVRIITGGILGTSTFQYTRDGGKNWSPTIATAATYVVPGSGVTINFAAGTYVALDTYSWTATAPFYSTSDFGAAYDVADTSGIDWELGHLIGQVGGANDAAMSSAAATVLSAIAAKLSVSFAAHRQHGLFVELPDVADTSAGDTALLGATNALSSVRLFPSYGFMDITDPITLASTKRSSAWAAVARARSVPLQRDLAAPIDGFIPTRSSSALITRIYHDENARPGPGTRFTTLRRFDGRLGGFYLTNVLPLSPPGSDFFGLQDLRVLDKCIRVARQKFLDFFLSYELRTYENPPPSGKTAGAIREEDAVTIEAEVNDRLFAEVTAKGYAIRVFCEINRNDVIQSTLQLRYRLRVKKWTYPKDILGEFGFAA